MGMFDYISGLPDMNCQRCGAPLSGWQSKDGDCSCSDVEFWRVQNFYTGCDKCWAWHEFTLKQIPRPLTDYELKVTASNAPLKVGERKHRPDIKPLPTWEGD